MILCGFKVWKWSCGGAVSVIRLVGRRHDVQRDGAAAGLRGDGTEADRLPEKAQHDLREARWGTSTVLMRRQGLRRGQIKSSASQSSAVTSKFCARKRRSMFTKMGGVNVNTRCTCRRPADGPVRLHRRRRAPPRPFEHQTQNIWPSLERNLHTRSSQCH